MAFVYQNNKRNESITPHSKSYIFGKFMEKCYIYLEKTSCLNLEPSTMIKTSCHFSPLLILEIRNYSSMFSFPWTSPSVNSQWHIKKMSALILVGGRDRGAGAWENRGRKGYGRREKKGREVGEKFKKASFSYLSLLIIQSKKQTQQRFMTSI